MVVSFFVWYVCSCMCIIMISTVHNRHGLKIHSSAVKCWISCEDTDYKPLLYKILFFFLQQNMLDIIFFIQNIHTKKSDYCDCRGATLAQWLKN